MGPGPNTLDTRIAIYRLQINTIQTPAHMSIVSSTLSYHGNPSLQKTIGGCPKLLSISYNYGCVIMVKLR